MAKKNFSNFLPKKISMKNFYPKFFQFFENLDQFWGLPYGKCGNQFFKKKAWIGWNVEKWRIPPPMIQHKK